MHDKSLKLENSNKLWQSLIPEYISNLTPYQAGKPIDELIKEKGISHVSKLASNENPLGPSPFALQKVQQALFSSHQYPDMHALELREEIAKKFHIKLENIILGNGSEGIMADIIRAFISPGDSTLTSENTFIGFYILARSAGANIIKVPLTHDYRFDIDAIIKNISYRTKIIYIANPNNPTGTYITHRELEKFIEAIPSNILVILDEAYYEFASMAHDYPNSLFYRFDNVITLRTFSKAYGLAGFRVGFGIGHEDLISNLIKIKLPFGPGLLAQKAALGALNDEEHLRNTLINNQASYQKTYNYLSQKGFFPVPSVANFIMFRTGSLEASQWLYHNLLNEGVIIRPLVAHEMPKYVRVSLGTEEEMHHFFTAMDKVLPHFFQIFQRELQ